MFFCLRCLLSGPGPRAAWLYLRDTQPARDIALQVWGHCTIHTPLVSYLVRLLYSFPDEEMEAKWRWWGWAQAGPQVARLPIQCLHPSPHPAAKRSDTHICSGEQQRRPGLEQMGWAGLSLYCQEEGQAPQSQGHSCLTSLGCSPSQQATCVKRVCLFTILRPFDVRIPFLQIWVKE